MAPKSRLAVVAMLPETDDPLRVDFVSREFDDWPELVAGLEELERGEPNWRVVSVCHVEDLPLLMEPPSPPAAPA